MSISGKAHLEVALQYAELGYKVFPLADGSKIPRAGSNGCTGATTDEAQIRAWWAERPSANIGLATEDLVVVDIDGAENPWPNDQDKASDLLAAPLSFTARGGKHFFYRQPAAKAYRCTAGELAPAVDTRANGGYVVVPPSRLKKGSYQFAEGMELPAFNDLPEPPDWLVGQLDALAEHSGGQEGQRCQSGAIPGGGEPIPDGQRNATLTSIGGSMRKLGLDLKAIEDALQHKNLVDCKPPLPTEEVARIARSVAGYPTGAQEAAAACEGVDLSGILKQMEPGQADEFDSHSQPQIKPEGLPEIPDIEFETGVRPGGIMDLTIKAMRAAEWRHQPRFHVSTALALMSLAVGRKVQTVCGLLPNLYLLNCCPTGEGKEIGAKLLRQADEKSGELIQGANEVEIARQVADIPHSDSGLYQVLRKDPVRLLVVDEFGQILGAGRKAQSSNQGKLFAALTKLFTHGRGTYAVPCYADSARQKQAGDISSTPFVSLLALTQRETLVAELSSADSESGVLPRCLLFNGFDEPEVKKGAALALPHALLIQLQRWRSWKPGGASHPDADPFTSWRFHPEAEIFLEELDKAWYKAKRAGRAMGDTSTLVYSRALEIVKKVALLLAADSLGGPGPDTQIQSHHVQLAFKVVNQSVEEMRTMVSDHVADSEYECLVKEVLAFIKKKNASGGAGRTLSEITKKFQKVPPNWRQLALNDLVERRVVKRASFPTSGRTGYEYTPI